jgi:hypothetical protein
LRRQQRETGFAIWRNSDRGAAMAGNGLPHE